MVELAPVRRVLERRLPLREENHRDESYGNVSRQHSNDPGLAAKTKRKFARFDFLRLADLHFDGTGAPVAVIDDALHVFDEELQLVVKCRAVLEACPRNVAEMPGTN
jgi:1,6-anhydro-N-acetylmuramate kinase